MKKISVIYWSGTGNTEAMAEAVAKGAEAGGNEVKLLFVADATEDDVINADALALGCPSMGDEELEDGEFLPFMESIEGHLKGKPLALFGSFEWNKDADNEGEWMHNWEEQVKDLGANLVADGLRVYSEPDADALSQCEELGAKL